MMHPKAMFSRVSRVCYGLVLFILLSSSAFAAGDTATATTDSNALSQLLKVLQNDQQRTELVHALEQAQHTSASKSGSSAASSLPKAASSSAESSSSKSTSDQDTVVNGGILGALSSSLSDVQDGLSPNNKFIQAWKNGLDVANKDWYRFKHRIEANHEEVTSHFLKSLGIWLGVAALSLAIGYCLRVGLWKIKRLSGHPKLSHLIRHWVSIPIPTIIAAAVSWYLTLGYGIHDIGRLLGLCLGFALVGGCLFASLLTSLAIVANGRHRRVAARILIRKGYIPCTLMASCAGFGESLTHSPLTPILGHALTLLFSFILSMISCITVIPLTFVYRRAINQMLFNRSLNFRRKRTRGMQRSLRAFKWLWPVCIVIMSLVGMYQLIHGSVTNNNVITHMILTMFIIIVGLLVATLCRQFLVPDNTAVQRDLISRFRQIINYVIGLILFVVFFEFITLIWGGSFFNYIESSTIGRLFAHAFFSIAGMLIVALAIWVALDVLIDKLLDKDTGDSARNIRIRTILPLLRNAAKIILCVVAIITILANIGINIAPLIAGAGVIGLAIGFGSQQLVHDVITGVFNILENTMSIGDYITVNGVTGTIEGMSIRTVRLRDTNGALISIPFSQVNTVRNLSRKFAYASTTVNFTLDSNVDHMLAIFAETADEIAQDLSTSQYILGPFINYGLEQVSQSGYTVGGKFRATTGGYSTVQYAFATLLARKVEQAEDVSFSRTYEGGKEARIAVNYPAKKAVDKDNVATDAAEKSENDNKGSDDSDQSDTPDDTK